MKFSQNRSSTEVSLKISKKDIKKKESQRSNPKNGLPEEPPKDMSLYDSFDFSDGGIGVAKITFSLERLCYGRIFLSEFGETFLAAFLPVGKNFGKMKQNVDSRRLTPKSTKLTCYPILKIQSRENTGKYLKISKTGMTDRWVLVQVKKYISVVWNMGQFDIGQF